MARPRRVRTKKIPEVVIAQGVISKTVPRTLIDKTVLPEGKKVSIARIVKTPIGLYFRIFETKRWIPEENISCDFNPNDIIDYSIKSESKNSFGVKSIVRKKRGLNLNLTENTKRCKSVKTSSKTNISQMNISNNGSRGKYKKQGRMNNLMDKKELKTAISELNTGDTITVTFLSTMPTGETSARYDGIRSFAGQTVEATLVETKKGRGKGGSLLMSLETEEGVTFVTGTPHSDVMLNITTPNGMLGHESEADIPRTFETNAGQASELKTQFKKLVGTSGATVRMESTEEELNGNFTVTQAEQLRGRHGQIRLTLEGENSTTAQVWSYRHSGVITSFEITGGITQMVEETNTEVETTEEETESNDSE